MRRLLLLLALSVALAPTLALAAEPDEVGPFAVDVDSYDFGDEVFEPLLLGRDAEITAAVYSPADLDDGPFPLIMMMHGRHLTCYDPANPGGTPGDGSFGGGFAEWPCGPNRIPIPSYDGYGYLGERLASHGFIVVSVSANAVNVFDNQTLDFGNTSRADVFSEHLALWAQWNERGGDPFGGRFMGAVDLDQIGMMGHSRGGEAVAKWITLDQADGEPDFIDAALLIAPANFERFEVGNVPLAVVLPYCDGDIFDLAGAMFVDDARDAIPNDSAPKYAFLMGGSNHNFYNTIWTPSEFEAGTADDFSALEEVVGPDAYCGMRSSERLSEAEQRESLLGYALAFFRVHLRGETEFEEVLAGDAVPVSASPAGPAVTYFGPNTTEHRLDVNLLDSAAALTANDLGEAVEASNLPQYRLCGLLGEANVEQDCVDEPGSFQGSPFDGRQPHTPGLGELRVEFSRGGTWVNRLPSGTDVSELSVLQFRVAIDFESPLAQANPDLRMDLADAAGNTATATVGDWSDDLGLPPGGLYPLLPKKVLRHVRVPLRAFAGVDLTDVASITLFVESGTAALLLSDLAFSDAVPEDPGTTGSSGGPPTTTGAGSSGDSSTTGPSGGTGSSDSSGSPQTTTTGSAPQTGDTGTGSDTDDASATGDDSGCGCRPSAPRRWSHGLWLLLALGWRRRSAARQQRPRDSA